MVNKLNSYQTWRQARREQALKKPPEITINFKGMSQQKFSFDKITLQKIAKGALIALSGAAGIGLLNYLGALEINNELLAMVVAWLVPTGINAIREWMKGQDINTEQ